MEERESRRMKSDNILILVSTPLHLLGALILAKTTFKAQTCVLILIDQKDSRYYDALRASAQKSPFDAIYMTGIKPVGLFARLRNKRRNRDRLRAIIEKHPPRSVITGNDRKIEFDYAMHLARTYESDVTGGYLDDGLHSYIPQKLHWYQYTLFDTLLQKLFLGRKSPVPRLIGTCAAVQEAFLFRPDLAHEALHAKRLHRLDTEALSRSPLRELLRSMADRFTAKAQHYPTDATLLILPHPSVKREIPGYTRIIDTLFALSGPLLLKRHPRDSEGAEATRCQKKRDCHLLPSDVAMELLLFSLQPRKVYSIRSSALLTLSWLMPGSAIYNIRTDAEYDTLFARFGIDNIAIGEIT